MSNISKRDLTKTIPIEILGVKVMTPTLGMEGTLEWLMKIRLHKYWPLFSNMTYSVMLSISEETIDSILAYLGSQQFPQGTRKKVIKSIQYLHSRARLLRSLDVTNIEESCQVISDVLSTPIAPFLEIDGSFLPDQIRETMTEVVNKARYTGSGHLLKDLVKRYSNHYAFNSRDYEIANQWMADLNRDSYWENFASRIAWNGFFCSTSEWNGLSELDSAASKTRNEWRAVQPPKSAPNTIERNVLKSISSNNPSRSCFTSAKERISVVNGRPSQPVPIRFISFTQRLGSFISQ